MEPSVLLRGDSVNWLGVWTLYKRELRRVSRILFQAVTAPIVSSLLYLAVFSTAVGKSSGQAAVVSGVPYAWFLAGGLVAVVVLDNSFSSVGSSLLVSKIQGNIVDILVSPLTAGEIVCAFVLAGVSRGVMVGSCAAFFIWLFVRFPIPHPLVGLSFVLLAAAMMSLLSLMAGLWAEKFDQLQMITSFVVMPLTFLSGTFYSVAHLPPLARELCRFNPVFYLVDGIRYGVTGHTDADLTLGIIIAAGISVLLWLANYQLVKSGYNIRT